MADDDNAGTKANEDEEAGLQSKSKWLSRILAIGLGGGFVSFLAALLTPWPHDLWPIVAGSLGAGAGLSAAALRSGVADQLDRVRQLRKRTEALEKLIEAPAEKAAEATFEFLDVSSTGKVEMLERESRRRQQLALTAFLLSLAGPSSSAIVVALGLDPHYLFASVALSGVPLTIAAMLLRHDGKMRRIIRELEREIAQLERVRLAVDLSKTVDEKYAKTIRKRAVEQILTMRAPPMLPEPNDDADDDVVKTMAETAKVLVKKGGTDE